MTWEDHVEAARLALPERRATTGITRIQELGLDVGPQVAAALRGPGRPAPDAGGRLPAPHGVKCRPSDDEGVSDRGRLRRLLRGGAHIDAIKVGCVLLHLGSLDLGRLERLLDRGDRGDAACAETRTSCPSSTTDAGPCPRPSCWRTSCSQGLPMPEVNELIELAPGVLLTPDLWFGLRAGGRVRGQPAPGGPRAVQRRHRPLRALPPARHRLRAGHQGTDAITEGDGPAGPRCPGASGATTGRRPTSAGCGRRSSARSPTSYVPRRRSRTLAVA